MFDHEHQEEIRRIVSEYMKGDDSEIRKLKCKISNHLAFNMTLSELQTLAIKETGEIIQYHAMGKTENMLKSYFELKIVMKAVQEHLPEGMIERIYADAVHGYAKMFDVKED
jgi:hypothetical protein